MLHGLPTDTCARARACACSQPAVTATKRQERHSNNLTMDESSLARSVCFTLHSTGHHLPSHHVQEYQKDALYCCLCGYSLHLLQWIVSYCRLCCVWLLPCLVLHRYELILRTHFNGFFARSVSKHNRCVALAQPCPMTGCLLTGKESSAYCCLPSECL